MPLQPGTILENRYRIDSLLGQGGMGAVYRAWHERLEQWVAIKENSLVTPEARVQFKREAKVLAQLHHTNLPNVIDHFVTADGMQYLVMTFVEGVNLAELLAARGKQSSTDVMIWLGQVCDALTYLHGQNPPVIHRDIKPQNIKITPDGHVFLVDFGLSKVGSTFQSTASGALGVTAGYAPLEQYGSAHTDQRSDVYALTATLYAMLTGETPPESVKLAVGTAALTPPRTTNLTVSPALERAILHGMETQPTNRPASVAALRQEVQAALGPPRAAKLLSQPPVASPTQAIPRPSPVRRAALSPARRERGLPGWTLAGMGALIVVLLVLGVAVVGRGAQPTTTVVIGNPTLASPTEGTVKPTVTVATTATPIALKDTDTPTPTATDTPVPIDTPTALPDAMVNSNIVNLRAGPGEAYAIAGRYPQNTPLRVVGKETQDKWLQVIPPDGKMGWMSLTLLRVNVALAGVAVVEVPPALTPNPTASGVATRTRAADGAVMVFVPSGEFTMGSATSQASNLEQPQHQVALADFWIDRTEVTNAQYRKFIDAGGYSKQEYWTEAGWEWKVQANATQPNCWDDSNLSQANQPVVCVSWFEAYAYARWVKGRLPNEAEWEKAARGTDGRTYPWGNAAPDCNRLNYSNCVGRTAAVGSYANGVSPYRALDLAGNVWEWVSSKLAPYPYNAQDGREDQSGTGNRVLRGGSWGSTGGRSTDRFWVGGPGDRNNNVGFRVAASGP